MKRLFNEVAESDAVSQIDWAIDTVEVTSSPKGERKLLVNKLLVDIAIDE